MKLRVTGIALGLLVLAAVIVPAFAAAVDRLDDASGEAGTAANSVGEVHVTEAEASLPVMPEAVYTEICLSGDEDADASAEIEAEEPVSDSPFYLNGEQMTELVYETFGSVDYVTVESFLMSMDPETVVEERRGVVSASAVTLSGVLDQEDDQTASAEETTLTLRAKKGSYYVEANGRYLYVANKVKTIDGKVAAPIKVLAKVYNLKVKYDDNGLIQLTTKDGADPYLEDGDTYYNEYTLYWLSHIIYSESGNQSTKGKIAVGNVVMNRVKSPKFPNNIKDVLFQKNQFSPAMSGSIYREPNKDSVIAAKMVMDGAVVLRKALFFNREGMDTYAARNRTYVTTIGGHDFYN